MGRPRAGAELDKAQVIEAAALLCDVRGWEALTLQALAEELRVRPPSLYNHVAGLLALRRELQRLARRELRDRFLVAAAGKNGAAGLRALAHAYRSFARERPGIYVGVVTAPDEDDPESLATAAEMIEILAAVMAPYQLRGDALIHAVRAFRSGLHGFVTLEQSRGFGLPQKLDESYARLVELLIAGIESR